MIVSTLGASGCGPTLRGTVPSERLRDVVQRDTVPFANEALPAELLERLARYEVVVVGEYHDITEHDAFVGELVAGLHAAGFRNLLLEFPQAYGWLLDGYARGILDTPGEGALRTYGPLLERVRSLNATLPAANHVRVHAIDVNARDDDFLPPFRGLAHQLGLPRVLTEAIESIEAGAARDATLGALEAALVADEERLRGAWGEGGYEAVLALVEAERRSLEVRLFPAGRRRDEAREALMKALVDRQLARGSGGTVVNVGLYHAQKTRRDGTVAVWLAEHLVRSSPHAQGRTFVLAVVPASGEKVFGERLRSFDVATDSPANELFRIMREVVGDVAAFLPLDDELFSHERVVVNYLPRIDTEPPALVFDGFVLLPEVRPAGR